MVKSKIKGVKSCVVVHVPLATCAKERQVVQEYIKTLAHKAGAVMTAVMVRESITRSNSKNTETARCRETTIFECVFCGPASKYDSLSSLASSRVLKLLVKQRAAEQRKKKTTLPRAGYYI